MPNIIDRLLQERGVLLADGATGSNLFAVGLQTGDCPELWNRDHPERIAKQYKSFIAAGSDIILTNTFGGTEYRLKLHGAAQAVTELNSLGAQLAREQVRTAGREVIVGGSMGPSGEIMQPLGPLSHSAATAAFAQQAAALKQGGVDVLWIETMSSREEAQAAIAGASSTGLPIIATFSPDTNGRTMMGLAPDDMVALLDGLPCLPDAIGVNCGIGAAEIIAATVNLQNACVAHKRSTVIVAKANCGVPQYRDGQIVYDGDLNHMAEYVRLAVDAGATIIGGCCGTTAAHVQAMRTALDQHRKQPSPSLTTIERKLGSLSSGAKAQLRGQLSIAAGAVSGQSERRLSARARRRAGVS